MAIQAFHTTLPTGRAVTDLLAAAPTRFQLAYADPGTDERLVAGEEAPWPAASLINVGRGALVDEGALKDALDAGRLHSAGLDTVCVEPLPQGHWMLGHDRVVLTPHDAGVSDQVFDKLTSMVREALDRHRRGEAPDFLLT